jgi:aminobenzoyl-glutamate utilization protein B
MIAGLSDDLWSHPELGLVEHHAATALASALEAEGFEVERKAGGLETAFVASWGEGEPAIGILGELDALPGLSQKAVPVREAVVEGGAGHGCGHNIHGAGGAAAAMSLRAAMAGARVPGTLRFYGCPAEETLDGKVWMAKAGCFDGVEAVLSHHPGSANTAHMGSSLAMNSARFHFHGLASHAAASPSRGRSALDAVELMNVGANYLREHVIPDVRLHYIIENGGVQPNVVPPEASSWYYVRAPERSQVENVYRRLLDIADGADLMAGTTHEVEFLTGCYNLLPNRRLCELVVTMMREIGQPARTAEQMDFARRLSASIDPDAKRDGLAKEGRPGWEGLVDALFDDRILDPWDDGEVHSGSTDVGDVSWVTPAIEFTTSTCMLGTPGHSWQFAAQAGMAIGHHSLLFAAKTMARAGLELLRDRILREEVRREWMDRLAGRAYEAAIPEGASPPRKRVTRAG